ncbi:hydrogenase expression/formation protein HypC [Marmoricola sp. URHA0025 HA25]
MTDMCLGIPGRITDTWQEDGAMYAHADFVGETRKICLNYLPDLQVGEFTIVHAGFALTRIDATEAIETVRVMREVGVLPAEASDVAS